MRKLAIMVAVGALGCGSTTPTQTVAGFTPPSVEMGELQIISPAVRKIAPGANITYCSYLPTRVAAETDVIGFRGAQSASGHHAILYVARRDRPIDTHECTEDDMINVKYLAGIGADKQLSASAFSTLPDGLAFRIPAGAQLMIQTHWINASLHPIDGQAAINLHTVAPSPSRTPADLFSVANTQFNVPAGMTGTSTSTCPIGGDIKLFYLGGHEHQWGTHVTIDHLDKAATPSRIYEHDWQAEYEFNPPINVYTKDVPLELKQGEGMRITCSWDNTAGSSALSFPSEMCVAFGFYYPSQGEIDCVDGGWPTN